MATSFAACLHACGGAHGATAAPSATDIARTLAHDPEFVEAVARRLAAGSVVTPISVPVDAPADAGVAATLTIAIDGSGTVLLDGRPITDAALAVDIRSRVAVTPQLRAVIAADRRVAHERVIQVIDLMRREGVTRFAMMVAPSP